MRTISPTLFRTGSAAALLALLALAPGCATNIPNASGRAAQDHDPAVRGPVAGTGIESRDIMAMTDEMLRDLLSTRRSPAARPHRGSWWTLPGSSTRAPRR
jgi:hypothetical protein